MSKRVFGLLVLGFVMSCSTMGGVSPEMLRDYQSRKLFTCCNLHYDRDYISDANYASGTLLPFATPAQVQTMQKRSATFSAAGHTLTLDQRYGAQQETFEQYLNKVLVSEDPTARFQTYSSAAQTAIREARVEKGMTRDQVIMSVGYPPTHRTASLQDAEWTYWYNTWVTYKVVFNAAGKVDNIVGSPAPTKNEPIVDAPAPRPTAKPAKRKH